MGEHRTAAVLHDHRRIHDEHRPLAHDDLPAAGVPRDRNGSKPAGSTDPALVAHRRVINLITPETASSAHYFWAIARAYRLDDVEFTEYIRRQFVVTFDQDKTILEAQQRAFGIDPAARTRRGLDDRPPVLRRPG